MKTRIEPESSRIRQAGMAAMAAVLCVISLNSALASERDQPRKTRKVQAVYESEKSWEFKKDMLVFYSENPNATNVRFIRWKGYNWVVTTKSIMVMDPRPYGTQLKAPRHRRIKDNKTQSDKDLMNELKKNAKKVRKAREPKKPGPRFGVGVGVGFGHHGHHHGGVGFGVSF